MSRAGYVQFQGQTLRPEVLTATLAKQADAHRKAGSGRVGKARALGLVSSSTSDMRSGTPAACGAVAQQVGATAWHLVDRQQSRLRKMKHGVLTNARLLSEQASRTGFRYRPVFITLTYRPGQSWQARHISYYLKSARQWMKRRGHPFRCVWTAEMQERGAVHYHVIVFLPLRMHLPKPDECGWWSYGKSNIKAARSAVGYIAKYASKGADGPAFPPGVRIHGAGGLDANAKREARWWRAPSEAREYLGAAADIRFVTGGRVDARTGAFWRSPWRFVALNGVHHIIRVGEQP